MSKGSKQRPAQVTRETYSSNYDKIFRGTEKVALYPPKELLAGEMDQEMIVQLVSDLG